MFVLFALYALVASAALLNATSSPDRENSTRLLGGLAANITGEDQHFHYVVVGGGTAGITLAVRLAEDPSVTVALIEAGSFYELTNAPISSTPFGDILGVGADISDANPAVDWEIVTTPQTGLSGRAFHYARGKTLGGSSARNFMIYQRPTKESLQIWADQVDDDSYTWDNFLPYFKKSVKFTPPNTELRAANSTAGYNDSAFSSSGGPLQVSYPNYAQPWSSYMQDGLNEIGINETEDFNSGSLLGAQYISATIDPNGEFRAVLSGNFLTAAANRTNLKVFQLTMAKKILFDSQNNATGVQVAITGLEPFTLTASKEVILSAGAFQSPQMLMVSGIGPKSTLQEFGIPVIVDNPNVGQNMWDHVLITSTHPVGLDSARLINDPDFAAAELAAWKANATGPYTNPGADFVAWEKVPFDLRQNFSQSVLQDLEFFPSDWPEVEVRKDEPFASSELNLSVMQYLMIPGFFGNFYQPSTGSYGTVLSGVVAPLSRGNVTIASADMDDLPIVNPNLLAHPADQALILAGFKRARQLLASESLQNAVIGEEFFPGPQFKTDKEIFEAITEAAMTIYHASCTCKMGKVDDPTAVIDTQGRVLGVQGLRVVDASSFPLLLQAILRVSFILSTDALAEKIADDIKLADSL
ncbi:alcohol oxidase [Gymnopus androsaceus JB14]|uniref:Alcohol oxidase n=1 Tax=Gymnopus androsaceus JB14 TaxID=1447944 RepID=A0A6A4GU32_9AGAR|nr:alcohol oxidase [Gymnopus androsaceus JB14]